MFSIVEETYKHPIRKSIFAGALIVCCISAYADASLNCNAYAAVAVSDHQLNTELGCQLSGPMWSDDFAGHFAWCQLATTKMANLTNQDRVRKNALKQCQQKQRQATQQKQQIEAQKKPACDTYAAVASAQALTNQKRQCGFTGGRWLTSKQLHWNWCMQAGPAAANLETQARANALINDCVMEECWTVTKKGIFSNSKETKCKTVPRP